MAQPLRRPRDRGGRPGRDDPHGPPGRSRGRARLARARAFHSNSLWDYPLHSGIVLSVGLSLLVLATGHYAVFTILYATSVYVLGVALTHSGVRETPAVKWALRVILLPIKIVPSAIRLEDHERHHTQGDCNYGVFFSHWDRLLGTWEPTADDEGGAVPCVFERFDGEAL